MNHVAEDSFDDGKTDGEGTVESKGIVQQFGLPATTDIRSQVQRRSNDLELTAKELHNRI